MRASLWIAAAGLAVSLGGAPAFSQQPAAADGVAPVAAVTVPAIPVTPAGDAKPVGDTKSAAPAIDAGAAVPSVEAKPTSTPAVLPAPAGKPTHDLTPMGMFLNADPVVQGVMVLLAIASVATWTILLVRGFALFIAKRRLRISLEAIRGATSLSDASERVRHGLGAKLIVETEDEVARSTGLPGEGIKERVAIALERIEAASAKRMAAGTAILATTGSIGPFVGLFGTVWGIMRSFIGIANSNTTNLAVVAPGIAEALLATGIGLVAAIPAVVIYNGLARVVVSHRALTADVVALIMRHLSRDLDRRQADAGMPKATLIRVAAE